MYFIKKAINHPKSKTELNQGQLVKTYFYTFCVISIIINFRATNHFFSNQDLFFTYTKYRYKFKIELGQQIIGHGYNNINLEIKNLQNIVNILILINMDWVSNLGYNLLSIIFFAKKSVKVFLKKVEQLSKIIIDKEVFKIADIIENQYIICLAKSLNSTSVNQVNISTIKTQHPRIGYLR